MKTKKSKENINIKLSLNTEIFKEKESGIYVAYCPELDLYSQGDNKKEAKKNIIEASELFLESYIENHIFSKLHDIISNIKT